MARYEYTPLTADGSHIRLLRLLPGRFSDDLEVEIFHAPFPSYEALIYEALSYVWGSTEDPRTILIRGGSRDIGPPHLIEDSSCFALEQSALNADPSDARTLAVTQNLEIALRHLRIIDRSRVIWIDAICINQDDVVERNAEVRRMGSIYSEASRVVVWLGPESDDSALVVQTMQMIGRGLEFSQAEDDLRTKVGTGISPFQNNPEASIIREVNWTAIKNLIEREWFTRLWVVQEIRVAAQAVMVVGDCNLSWDIFRVAFDWIWMNVRTVTSIFDETYLRHLYLVINRSKPLTTMDLLLYAWNLKCLDPRDKVYALLGLLDEDVSLGIAPDYSLSKEEVYKDLVVRYTHETLYSSLLRLCVLRNFSSLPSWVPDFSGPEPPEISEFSHASGYSKHEGFYDPINGNLCVRGVPSGTINNVRRMVPKTASVPEILVLCRSWEPQDLEIALYRGGGTILDAFLSTLLCGHTREVTGTGPSLEECRSFYDTFVTNRRTEELPGSGKQFIELLRRNLLGRSFFTTSNGYIGLCPAVAKPGDRLCVVLGCETPLLLRPLSNGHYQIVGECFVHGLGNCEGLLGPIPCSWERKLIYGNGWGRIAWIRDGEIYLDDPRLGFLPSKWRKRYGDIGNPSDHPYEDDGSPRFLWFENLETGDWTNFDPRLTSQALIAKGVDIEDFVLV
jgi:hypothetical protein